MRNIWKSWKTIRAKKKNQSQVSLLSSIPRFLLRKPGGISNREEKKTDSFHGNSSKLHDRSHSQPPETRLRIRAIGWWAVWWGGRTEGSSLEGNDLWPTSQPWYCYPFPWTAAKYSISTNLSPLALQILYLYHFSLSPPPLLSRKHGNFVPLPLYRCSCTLRWCLTDYCASLFPSSSSEKNYA